MPTAKNNKGPLGDRVTTPDQIAYLNLLVYGRSGVGKTFLCGTAQDHPKTSPVLLLDVEGGTTTLHRRSDIDVIRVKSTNDIVDNYNILRTQNDGYYKTVVIDSLSELQDVDMSEIMRKRDREADIAEIREWGQNRNHIRKIIRAFRDLEVNTIVTALLDVDKDSQTGAVTYQPALPGKLQVEIPGFLDIVGYYYATVDEEGIKRTIQFAQTRRVIAKDRTATLGDKLDDPTIPMMWDMLHNGASAR